jgi:hypothetical protein
MGGGRGARGCAVLSTVGRRSSAALVLHDRSGADRGHDRSPRGDVPDARGRGHDRTVVGAGSAGSSEFSKLGRVAVNRPVRLRRYMKSLSFLAHLGSRP